MGPKKLINEQSIILRKPIQSWTLPWHRTKTHIKRDFPYLPLNAVIFHYLSLICHYLSLKCPYLSLICCYLSYPTFSLICLLFASICLLFASIFAWSRFGGAPNQAMNIYIYIYIYLSIYLSIMWWGKSQELLSSLAPSQPRDFSNDSSLYLPISHGFISCKISSVIMVQCPFFSIRIATTSLQRQVFLWEHNL